MSSPTTVPARIDPPDTTVITGAAGWLGTGLVSAFTDGAHERDGRLRLLVRDTTDAQLLPWFNATQALLAYRDGDAVAAIASARRSLALAETNLSSYLRNRVTPLGQSVLALAHNALGDRDAAFVALEAASSTLARLETLGQRDVDFARTLFDEARSALEGSQD